MRIRRLATLSLAGTLGLGACASNGAHYEPIIDAQRDRTYYQDLTVCQDLAQRKDLIDGETTNRALLGAGLGALIGVTRRGDDLENAAVGATVGLLGGGATVEREEIVKRCMSGRGYRVLG